MSKTEKKEALTAFHKNQILTAAEHVFFEKGFENATIDDISAAANYSRRTIYVYFIDKQDILYHTIAHALKTLCCGIADALEKEPAFFARSRIIFALNKQFQEQYPYSAGKIDSAAVETSQQQTEAVQTIFLEGERINGLLVQYLKDGQNEGIVDQSIDCLAAVFILTSSLSALHELVQTKGSFVSRAVHVPESDFLRMGYRQLLRGIVKPSITIPEELL